jgi:hypothetical protein
MKKFSLHGIIISLLLSLICTACGPLNIPASPPGVSPAATAETTSQSIPVEPVAVQQLTILSSSAESQFPAKLIFNLKTASSVNITDIRLHYRIEQESFANVTGEAFIVFTPSTTIQAQWTWDMVKTGGLPTGAGVSYWWTVTDSSNKKIESAHERINFDDNRYIWSSIGENRTTIYWYNQDLALANQLLKVATEAETRLYESTGAYLKTPVKIYIYESTQDLQGAMIFPADWTGGVAFAEFGIIAIGINQGTLDWGKGALAHELTHLVVHQMTFNPYSGMPTWLDEGLAMYNEGSLDPSFTNILKTSMKNNTLISVRSLASPFSADANEALLSYAQSYSIVEYLVTTYGQGKMLDLLNTFKEGSTYDDAFRKVYGFDMEGLNSLWLKYAFQLYPGSSGLRQNRTDFRPENGMVFDFRERSLCGAGIWN